MSRTFAGADWKAAEALWTEGAFSDEWRPWRLLAAMAGIIYPPAGTRWDSWEDDSPSQRAILVRAMRETPALLRASILGAGSWSDVIRRVLAGRDAVRSAIEPTPPSRDPSSRHAAESIRAILGRIFAR